MQKRLILILFFSSLILLLTNTLAAAQDSTKLKAIKKNKFIKPQFIFIGLDPIKLASLPFDSTKKTMSFFAETKIKKDLWLTLNAGYANAKYNNNKINFSSNSAGANIQLGQTFFKSAFANDFDNAFAGFGYGVAFASTSKANYTIVDSWGTYSGTIDASKHLWHWVELNAGFRFSILPKWAIGWRINGKSAINPNVFKRSVAPVYIAQYGVGDKSTSFFYNFLVAYKINR